MTTRVLADAVLAGDAAATLAAVYARSVPMPTGCWRWAGATWTNGYPRTQIRGRQYGVHRLVAAAVHGDRAIHGQPVHHTCGVRRCVSPTHLLPVTQVANAAEMLARRYFVARIAALEAALALHDPGNGLLTCADGGVGRYP